METFGYWFHYLAEVLYYVNPFMMILASCLWMRLYCKSYDRMTNQDMRLYVLEQQIEYFMAKDREHWDPNYINMLKKLNEDYRK